MIYHLALGSNLGDTCHNLTQVVDLLGVKVGIVQALSSVITTEPEGFDSNSLFSNQVISIESELTPMEMLRATQAIEKEMGRTTKSINRLYSDRIIDIDIILAEDQVYATEELTVPHPLFRKRGYVMIPLHEIAPEVIDPVTHKSVRELYNDYVNMK